MTRPAQTPPGPQTAAAAVPALRIRPFASPDRAAVVALWHACGLTRPWNDPDADISLCLASAEAALLVADIAGQVAGSVMVGHDGHRGWVYYLAVDPARQGGGIGRQLMQAAESWLRAKGIPKLMLMVRPENARVRAFYEKLGYGEEPRLILTRRLQDG